MARHERLFSQVSGYCKWCHASRRWTKVRAPSSLEVMNTVYTVGKASLLLNAVLAPFRATGVQRGSRLIDVIPAGLLGGRVIWVNTDAGPLVLRVDDLGARELLIFGHNLPDVEETRIVCALLPFARGMLDIGASYGLYTKFGTNLMDPEATKIALEANPEVAACLGRSLSGSPGVRVLNVVATDRPKSVRFHCASASGLSSAVRDVGVPIAVDGLPVDDIWPCGQPLDFVKCDVEGGELDVLRGARRIRKSYEPVWMLEFDEQLLGEADVDPIEVADEVADLSCWWRSDKDGWVLAGNLGDVVGEVRSCQNVFLVPPSRAAQFTNWIKRLIS
jgi:FkbM family methyltransferase